MGLIKDGDRVLILSDILGLEDHLGDMDFKVTGTREGITALQMDIKIEGITIDLMRQALEQARAGRLHILEKMQESLSSPRDSLAPHAPRIYTLQIKTRQNSRRHRAGREGDSQHHCGMRGQGQRRRFGLW